MKTQYVISILLSILLSISFLSGCVPQTVLPPTQQLSQNSGRIDGENQAALIDVEAAKPHTDATGAISLNSATTELTNQATDITNLNKSITAQNTSYQNQIKADQKEYNTLKSTYDTQNGRWYVILGKFLAIWNRWVICILVVGLLLKGISLALPAPYGTILGVISTVILSVYTCGLLLICKGFDAIGTVIKTTTTTVSTSTVVK